MSPGFFHGEYPLSFCSEWVGPNRRSFFYMARFLILIVGVVILSKSFLPYLMDENITGSTTDDQSGNGTGEPQKFAPSIYSICPTSNKGLATSYLAYTTVELFYKNLESALSRGSPTEILTGKPYSDFSYQEKYKKLLARYSHR